MPSTDRERDHRSSRARDRSRERERDRNHSRGRTDRRSRDSSRVYTVFVKHLPDDVKYVNFCFSLIRISFYQIYFSNLERMISDASFQSSDKSQTSECHETTIADDLKATHSSNILYNDLFELLLFSL